MYARFGVRHRLIITATLPRTLPSLAALRLSSARPKFSAPLNRNSLISFAAQQHHIHLRAFSVAPGSSSQSDEKNSSNGSDSSTSDDASVKKVSPRKWKWLSLLIIGTGATIALAYDDLTRENWSVSESCASMIQSAGGFTTHPQAICPVF
jgi:hypothetical protein